MLHHCIQTLAAKGAYDILTSGVPKGTYPWWCNVDCSKKVVKKNRFINNCLLPIKSAESSCVSRDEFDTSNGFYFITHNEENSTLQCTAFDLPGS
jgi:hypothetical protein